MTARHRRPTADTTAARPTARRSFVGTFLDSPDEALIVLRGGIDAATVERVSAHLEGVLAGGARFVTVDAGSVDTSHAGLLKVFGLAQQRLGARRGMLCVRGLHPDLFAGSVVDGPGAAMQTHSDPQPVVDTP